MSRQPAQYHMHMIHTQYTRRIVFCYVALFSLFTRVPLAALCPPVPSPRHIQIGTHLTLCCVLVTSISERPGEERSEYSTMQSTPLRVRSVVESYQALANNSPAGRFHQIDGVVLTKFDTIDTKVYLTYKARSPHEKCCATAFCSLHCTENKRHSNYSKIVVPAAHVLLGCC